MLNKKRMTKSPLSQIKNYQMAKSGQYLWEPLKMKGKDDINSYTSNY